MKSSDYDDGIEPSAKTFPIRFGTAAESVLGRSEVKPSDKNESNNEFSDKKYDKPSDDATNRFPGRFSDEVAAHNNPERQGQN